VRGVLTDWLPGVADAVRDWLKDVEHSRGGPKPVAYPYLKDMDPYVAAFVALRQVLDSLANPNVKLMSLALEIGRTCEHEQRVRYWEATEPALFYHYAKEMEHNRSTGAHKRRVNINRFNHLLKETDMEWTAWSSEAHFRVGVALLDTIIRKTGWFELRPDPNYVHRRGSKAGPALILAAKEEFHAWLGRAMDNAELNSPDYLPTVMPPRRWEGAGRGEGGYWTPYVKAPRLVRFKASQESQREFAADEYDALDMPKVFDALHLLQETAWRVNRKVLEVAMTIWAKSSEGGVAKLPQLRNRDMPARTPRMVAHDELQKAAGHKLEPDEATDKEIRAWKRKAAMVYQFNAKRFSRTKATSSTILVAQQYVDYPAIYFPHMLDFRGRIYPIANFLQPQGSDLARGLLEFSEGLPITEENGGAGWLAIQLASAWGNDKVSYDERIRWVEENEELWRMIADDPYLCTDWHTADKPFQALAAILEWVDFMNHGWGYVSRQPIMVDGTCNGIQHLSAILRDEIAGTYVNLIPSDAPQDIYKVVAVGSSEVEGLQAVLERIERAGGPEGAKASYWLTLCDRDLPRTLTKRQVMVLPYGGTKDSFFNYTRKWLDEHDPVPEDIGNLNWLREECERSAVQMVDEEGKPHDPSRLYMMLRNARIVFLSLHMWDAVGKVVSGGMKVMRWLQDCAKAVASTNQPIFWQVPSGFVVRHFYGLDQRKRVEIMLDGSRVQLDRHVKTDKLSTKEQTQGISPNFIHSLDASALVACLTKCKAAGIEEFVSVHDAYGTHAANMNALSRFLREAFVETHENDVLGIFRSACQRVLVDWLVSEKHLDVLEAAEKADAMLPEPLEKGSLDIRMVLQSDYFFA
jgi:DNA-directed RNA polymerase